MVVAEASGPGSFHRLARAPPVPAPSSRVSTRLGDPSGPARRAAYGDGVTEPAPHMTPEQFRQHGHEVVDWIADYWARIGSFPVRSQVSPGEVPEPLLREWTTVAPPRRLTSPISVT